MRNSLLLYCIFFSILTNAQREADCVYSGAAIYYNTLYPPPYAPSILKFNENELASIDDTCTIAISPGYSTSSFADKNGNFCFVTNGWRLVNSFGEVLAYKLWDAAMPHPGGTGDTTEVLFQKGPLFLAAPGDSTKAYLFYGQFKYLPYANTVANQDVFFSYAYLDIPSQQLISKNNTISTDTTSLFDINATRHANGRDWWITKNGKYSNEIYIGLLSNTGMGTMQKYTIAQLEPRIQNRTYSFFNEQGNKYVHFMNRTTKYIQTYDFDRCTGTFSNPREYDLNDSLRGDDFNACVISPDGSKFYVLRLTYLDTNVYRPGVHQFDFETQSFTRILTVGGLIGLTPNYKEILITNKVFINDSAFIFTLNRITQPDSLGLQSNYLQNTDTTLNFIGFTVPPNFANHRLGVLEGSGCDTLGPVGLANKIVVEPFLLVYPNPNQGLLNIKLSFSKSKATNIRVYNSSGQQVLQSQLIGNNTQVDLRTLSLPSGVYWVEVLCNEQLLRQKFVYCGDNY